ncbi:MAG: carboxypeptidase-like regulatory domain-containing protein, partial [Bacteroidota bacterium]
MRFFLILTCVFSAQLLFSQEKKISFSADDKAIIDILDELEKEFEVRFSYSVDELSDERVTIDLKDASLSEILEEVFRGKTFSFEKVDNRFVTITSTAQSLKLRLRLVDANTKELLPFSTARVKGTYNGFVTDENGELNAVIPNAENTTLELSFVGYQKRELSLAGIKSDEIITVELQTSVEEMQGLTVKEYLTAGIEMNDIASEIRFDLQNLEILPGLPERDVMLSTQILAGVSSVDESAGAVNIRGSSNDNSFIYWNDIPVYQSSHYFGNISSFIPASIGNLSLFKNYIPSSYGGASAALLILESREIEENQPDLEANLNLTHADVFAAMPFDDGKGEVSVAGRRSFNDLIATPTFNSISNKIFEGSLTEDVQTENEEFEYNSKLVFTDFNIAGNYQPNSRNEFKFSALRSKSTLDYSSTFDLDEIEERSTQEHNVSSTGFNLSWTNRLSDRLASSLSSSFTDYRMDYGLLFDIEIDEADEQFGESNTRNNELRNWETRLSFTNEITT